MFLSYLALSLSLSLLELNKQYGCALIIQMTPEEPEEVDKHKSLAAPSLMFELDDQTPRVHRTIRKERSAQEESTSWRRMTIKKASLMAAEKPDVIQILNISWNN